jgi:ABC-type antimicrobial peptide transport system permease subunit
VGIVSAVLGLALVGFALAQGEAARADTFFGAGALLLIAGLGFTAGLLGSLARTAKATEPSLTQVGIRGCARRRSRSLAVAAMLACGSFLILSIGAFRLDANRDATKRSSGTGGFTFIGETTLPLVQDLNTKAGRENVGLNERDLEGVSFVPFRVKEGDEASCLNLNRAQRPRLLGVNPELLAQRGAFTFAKLEKGTAVTNGWQALNPQSAIRKPQLDEIPAIGDANSIQWAMGKKVGDTIEYTDERGQPFKVRIVGAVANSILQGQLIIDEVEFVKRFPSAAGYRYFLVDAQAQTASNVSAVLTRALTDEGLELTLAATRLAQFNAVQNTYLNTFQVLGGLGLLLGSAGLGVVVLRNVLERRGELALLLAVGFTRRLLARIVLVEHVALLAVGLIIGVVAAAIAVLPTLISPAAERPSWTLIMLLAGVLANGLVWTWLATRWSLRGRLLDALRNE